MNTYRAPLSAAALAGGQSRRMGSDKALLPLVAGGQPMLGVVLERLGAVADDVVVVANDQARYAALGARVVPDLRVTARLDDESLRAPAPAAVFDVLEAVQPT